MALRKPTLLVVQHVFLSGFLTIDLIWILGHPVERKRKVRANTRKARRKRRSTRQAAVPATATKRS